MTIDQRRQRVERTAVANMQAAFRLYEKMEADRWNCNYHSWKQEAFRLAQAAAFGFKVARR